MSPRWLAQAPVAFTQQKVLDDNAAGAAAPTPQLTVNTGLAAVGAANNMQHIATLPMGLISAFIGARGSNVNELRAQYGHAKVPQHPTSTTVPNSDLHAIANNILQVNVDKANGMVTTDSPNFVSMGGVVQNWIASQPQAQMGGGGGGGGSGFVFDKPKRGNNHRRR
jgi:hypothetical protein